MYGASENVKIWKQFDSKVYHSKVIKQTSIVLLLLGQCKFWTHDTKDWPIIELDQY